MNAITDDADGINIELDKMLVTTTVRATPDDPWCQDTETNTLDSQKISIILYAR